MLILCLQPGTCILTVVTLLDISFLIPLAAIHFSLRWKCGIFDAGYEVFQESCIPPLYLDDLPAILTVVAPSGLTLYPIVSEFIQRRRLHLKHIPLEIFDEFVWKQRICRVLPPGV